MPAIAWGQPGAQVAEPMFITVDKWGQKITGVRITLATVAQKEQDEVQWKSGMQLPTGQYVVRATASGMAPLEARITLLPGKEEYVIGAKLGRISDERENAVSGVLETDESRWGSCDRVMAIPLYGGESDIHPIHRMFGKRFHMSNVDPGLYLFTLFRGTEYCFATLIDIRFSPNQTIVLTPTVGAGR
jgi:hypothetical protein